MRFDSRFLEEIKERISISDVVGRRVSWDKRKTQASKGDYWACCPFHGEKTPSFHCDNRKGRYYCFGCGESGDHFKFMTSLDGVSFPEAVTRLAEEAGLQLPAQDPEAEKRQQQRATLIDVMQMARQYFIDQLQTDEGAKARAYLRDRGLSFEVQKTFGIGYAPEGRNKLKQYLVDQKIDPKQIEACGLVVFGPDIAVSYDRFRDRIMFPIEDVRGRTIAFGGRALSSDVPAKYLNSPETELFKKSNILFNHSRARKTIYDQNQAIVAEGYMDVIALHAAGFHNAVAPLGTALTENHLQLLWKMCAEPILCFDGDGAGVRAAHRSIDIALSHLVPGKSLRFALLPEGLDPDDLIKQSGSEAMGTVVNQARPLADMIWARETSGAMFDTPERRAQLEDTLKKIAYEIKNEAVRRHYDQDFRQRLQSYFGVQKNYAKKPYGNNNYNKGNYTQGARGGNRNTPSAPRNTASESLMNSALMKSGAAMPPLREVLMIVSVFNHPQIGYECFDAFAALELSNGELQQLHSVLLDLFSSSLSDENGAEIDLTRDSLMKALEKKQFLPLIQRLERQLQNLNIWQALKEADKNDARKGFEQAHLLYLRNHALHEELKLAQKALAEDYTEANFQRLNEIWHEINSNQGVDAIIEGFGAASGRPESGF
jgi:DNA primase